MGSFKWRAMDPSQPISHQRGLEISSPSAAGRLPDRPPDRPLARPSLRPPARPSVRLSARPPVRPSVRLQASRLAGRSGAGWQSDCTLWYREGGGASNIACGGILGEVGANLIAYTGVRGKAGPSSRNKIVGHPIWRHIRAPGAFV